MSFLPERINSRKGKDNTFPKNIKWETNLQHRQYFSISYFLRLDELQHSFTSALCTPISQTTSTLWVPATKSVCSTLTQPELVLAVGESQSVSVFTGQVRSGDRERTK